MRHGLEKSWRGSTNVWDCRHPASSKRLFSTLADNDSKISNTDLEAKNAYNKFLNNDDIFNYFFNIINDPDITPEQKQYKIEKKTMDFEQKSDLIDLLVKRNSKLYEILLRIRKEVNILYTKELDSKRSQMIKNIDVEICLLKLNLIKWR